MKTDCQVVAQDSRYYRKYIVIHPYASVDGIDYFYAQVLADLTIRRRLKFLLSRVSAGDLLFSPASRRRCRLALDLSEQNDHQ